MWRFLLPAFAMTAALIVLFAGALGDVHSWPNLSDKALTIIGGVAPSPAPPSPPPATPPARTAAAPAPPAPSVPATAGAELQAARDALRRQITDLQRQAGELQQQNAQRSHDMEQSSHDLDAARAETEKLRQGIETLHQQQKAERQTAAAAPTAAAIAEQQAARDALQRQIADLQQQSGELQQQVAQRSHDMDQSSRELDAARSESKKLRRDIEALEQFRKTVEHQIADPTRPLTSPLGPPPTAGVEQSATQDELRRQNADLKQQVAQRSHDLDAARAETSKLQQDIEALNQLRKTQEQQIATAASARPSTAASAEQQAAQDTMRRQIADLQQQVAQRSHDLDIAHAEAGKLQQDIDALNQLRKTQEQQIAAATSARPSAAAIAEQQAAQDAQRRQIADLQQQVAQRSHDLDAAHAETGKLRQDIDALNQLRKTQEQQIATAASARPSAAAIAEQQAAQDALRRQVADLQQQVAQRSHDLDAAHAETGKLRQDIDALNQLRKTQEQQIAAAASARPSAPGRSAAASTEQQPAQDAMRRQIVDLQQQVAQRSHDLDAARADTAKLREGFDALRQQRNVEEAAAARQKAQEQQMAAAAARARPTPPPAQRATQPTPPAPVAPPSLAPPVPPPTLAPPVPQPASPQLLTARQWLATGRPDEARRVLAMVQTRMVLQPVTPDRPDADGGNPAATDVGNAIRWLDIGANGQAMQAIDRAIGNANSPVSAQPWSGYPPGVRAGYPQQGFATNGSSR